MDRSLSSRQHYSTILHLGVLPIVCLMLAFALLSFHVRAEATTIPSNTTQSTMGADFLERFSSGPQYLTAIDIVLFVALGIIAIESLNWFASHSVGKCLYYVLFCFPEMIKISTSKPIVSSKTNHRLTCLPQYG